MVWIKTTCDWCGDVDLAPDQVTVRLCSADMSVSHVFVCPGCGRGMAHGLDPAVTGALFDAGCGFEVWERPAELTEPRLGAPICHDDLLAMHELLASPGWEEQILGPACSDETASGPSRQSE